MGKYQQKNVWLFVHVLNLLCWPALESLLDPKPGQHILDIACGNGLTFRLAALGAKVTAFDFSTCAGSQNENEIIRVKNLRT